MNEKPKRFLLFKIVNCGHFFAHFVGAASSYRLGYKYNCHRIPDAATGVDLQYMPAAAEAIPSSGSYVGKRRCVAADLPVHRSSFGAICGNTVSSTTSAPTCLHSYSGAWPRQSATTTDRLLCNGDTGVTELWRPNFDAITRRPVNGCAGVSRQRGMLQAVPQRSQQQQQQQQQPATTIEERNVGNGCLPLSSSPTRGVSVVSDDDVTSLRPCTFTSAHSVDHRTTTGRSQSSSGDRATFPATR
jgi:hypothetical protein